MDQPTRFEQLLERVMDGDEVAATEFYETYKGPILRTARGRMKNIQLRREIDSNDILNTVMKSFFARIGKFKWKLDTEDDLLKLLRTMTRNKIFDRIRKKETWKGGGKLTELSAEVIDGLSRGVSTPAEFAAIKELAEMVWECMPPDLRELYRMRFVEKMPWDQIGLQLGSGADACRKQTQRGFEEIAQQFAEHYHDD